MTQLDEITDAFEDGVKQGISEERARIVALLKAHEAQTKIAIGDAGDDSVRDLEAELIVTQGLRGMIEAKS